MSYLIDSDVLIDSLRGAASANSWIKAHADEILVVSIITVAELYAEVSCYLTSIS